MRTDRQQIEVITSPPQSNLGRARRLPSRHTSLAPISPQNCPFPFDDHHSHLIHPSLHRSHSPPQNASGSNQPFYHNTLSGQTDTHTPTHGIGDRSIPTAFTLYNIMNDALIATNRPHRHPLSAAPLLGCSAAIGSQFSGAMSTLLVSLLFARGRHCLPGGPHVRFCCAFLVSTSGSISKTVE